MESIEQQIKRMKGERLVKQQMKDALTFVCDKAKQEVHSPESNPSIMQYESDIIRLTNTISVLSYNILKLEEKSNGKI